MQVFKDFFSSEKGVFAYLIPLIFASVFVFTGKITYEQWLSFTMVIAGIYTGGKAIQGVAAKIVDAKNAPVAKNAPAATNVAAAAPVESAKLQTDIAANDARADAALEAKFAKKD